MNSSCGSPKMNLDRAVLALGGTMILASLLLAHFHSAWWLWLTAFVGANMLQSACTGFCLPAMVLKKLGVPPGAAFR